MKSKAIILFSLIVSLTLLSILVYHNIFDFLISLMFILLVVTSHILLFQRYRFLNREIERVNETLENLVAGEHGTRIYATHKKTRILNANVNRLAKQMEKMSIKKFEDEQMIKLLTDYITSPIIYIDIDGRVRYVNDQFKKKFRVNIKTNEIYELISSKEIYRFIDEAFIKELDYVDTIKIADHYYHANAVTIKDLRDRFVGILFIFNDITEIKRFEKLQREFLADASHELKTPISAIKGATEILLDRPHKPETVVEFLTMIQAENNRMEGIVQDILLTSKLESDINLSFQEIDLISLLMEVVSLLKRRLEKKEQQLILELEDELVLVGDYERLKHAFFNLLINASNYTENGKTIFVRSRSSIEHVYVEIEDQGIGISKRDLPYIFDRFYRVDKDRSRETGGTGLGLSIVKSVMDVHNGQIKVQSCVNKGTTFTLIFPRKAKIINE